MRLLDLAQRPVIRDAGLALLLAATSLLLGARTFGLSREQNKQIIGWALEQAWADHVVWWWLATLPAIVGLLARRRWPLPAFLLAAGSAGFHQLDPALRGLPMDLAAVFTLYTLASLNRSRRTGITTAVIALAGVYLISLTTRAVAVLPLPDLRAPVPFEIDWPDAAIGALSTAAVPALLLGFGWALGDNIRTRRLHLATLQDRAAALDREKDHRAALAVAAERSRLTRELHDVIAHGISVIVVQAQGGAAALRNHPDRTATALGNVIDTGRASLAEMRRLFTASRDGLDTDPELAPQPGLGVLPALIDQARDAGTPVTLHVDGEPVPLPSTVDLSAYRIIQEALTNTRRHAGPGAHASVRLAFTPTHLDVDISDDGGTAASADRPSDGEGNGLSGITERVTTLGGSITTGPRPDGGFAIHARLPLTTPLATPLARPLATPP